VGIFWTRIGAPTRSGQTGTEHEFSQAYSAWKQTTTKPQVMIYFKQKDRLAQTLEECDQRKGVLAFRETFPAEGIWWDFTDETNFETEFRNTLSNYLRTLEARPANPAGRASWAQRQVHPVSRRGPIVSPAPPTSKEERKSLQQKVTELGLVDIALRREDINWKYAERNLEALLTSVPEGGEIFIIARSLETWFRPRNYLELLGKIIVERRIRCTIAIPHPHMRIKSLVLNDPSQNVQEDLWEQIKGTLTRTLDAAMRDVGSDVELAAPRGASPEGRPHLEIYGIPAYVPATFSLISGRDGVEYCTLEVGIGVPPKEPRVYLYFQKLQAPPTGMDVFRRLESIYRGILRERTPILRLPTSETIRPECRAALAKRYDSEMQKAIHGPISLRHLGQDPDLYDDSNGREWVGDAVCLATSPLENYIGGKELLDLSAEIRRDLSHRLDAIGPTADAVCWYSAEQLYLPIYYYKRSFDGKYIRDRVRDDQVFSDMQTVVEEHPAFDLSFERILVDSTGAIQLLAFCSDSGQTQPENTPTLTSLRAALDSKTDREGARFASKRPFDIAVILGRTTRDISSSAEQILKNFPKDANCSGRHVALHIDQLRLVVTENGFRAPTLRGVDGFDRLFLREKATWQNYIVEYKNPAVYGVMSSSKLFAHSDVVEHLKRGAFGDIMPITAHLAPSLECTNQCPICSYGRKKACIFEKDSLPLQMSSQDMMRSLRALSEGGVKGVIFTGGGEPLKNQYTLDGMHEARLMGLSVGLFTNGQLLDKDACARIATVIKPSFVRVSLNAGNPEAYSLIHGTEGSGASFEQVLQNLSLLAAQKAAQKRDPGSQFHLDIGVLITPLILDNLLDLAYEIMRIAFRYPGSINNVAFRPAISYEGGCWDNDSAARCVDYLRRSPDAVATELAEQFLDFVNCGHQFPPALFDRALRIINDQVNPIIRAHEEGKPPQVTVSIPERRFSAATVATEDRVCSRCLACPLVVFVGPDTTVYHCVERALDERLAYGKLNQQDLRSIWAGPTRLKLISALAQSLDRSCPPVCLLHEDNATFNWIAKAREFHLAAGRPFPAQASQLRTGCRRTSGSFARCVRVWETSLPCHAAFSFTVRRRPDYRIRAVNGNIGNCPTSDPAATAACMPSASAQPPPSPAARAPHVSALGR
jgi:pyruvate-formate lyase-activating enzyme